ncbi:MAG: hypothetical protein FJ403_06725 [Verrucomicrobia bacterium]|nr:hypothetical protein [Verrucomicrobiota bacterium]
MSKPKCRDISAEAQHVLDHGHLRLLTSPEDIQRCDALIVEHHYLHAVTLAGEHLRYASVCKGRWQDQIVIVDGKKVRHAGVEIVNAADSQGRFLGSTVTARKSNEIPAFQSRFKSAHGGRERLHALIHPKLPSVLDLGNRKDASYPPEIGLTSSPKLNSFSTYRESGKPPSP